MADNELETCWQDLRPTPVESVSGPTKLQQSLKIAHERSTKRLFELVNEKRNAVLTNEFLASLIGHAITIFMEEWHNGIREENLAGLIELILEGQELTASEMNEFVRALPYDLLGKICESAVKSATGIHGLMAIEYARRNRTITGYTVVQDGKRTYVEVKERTGEQFQFYLDEKFELDGVKSV